MSSDLFDGEDHKGVSLMADMNVHNTLFLTAMGKEERNYGDRGEDMVTFTFRPDAAGMKSARELRDALDGWIKHVEKSQ